MSAFATCRRLRPILALETALRSAASWAARPHAAAWQRDLAGSPWLPEKAAPHRNPENSKRKSPAEGLRLLVAFVVPRSPPLHASLSLLLSTFAQCLQLAEECSKIEAGAIVSAASTVREEIGCILNATLALKPQIVWEQSGKCASGTKGSAQFAPSCKQETAPAPSKHVTEFTNGICRHIAACPLAGRLWLPFHFRSSFESRRLRHAAIPQAGISVQQGNYAQKWERRRSKRCNVLIPAVSCIPSNPSNLSFFAFRPKHSGDDLLSRIGLLEKLYSSDV